MQFVLRIKFGDDKAGRVDAASLMVWASMQLWVDSNSVSVKDDEATVRSNDQRVVAMFITHLLREYTPREGFKAYLITEVS